MSYEKSNDSNRNGIIFIIMYKYKVVQYNTERLNNIEEYLKKNKFIKPSENVEKLKERRKNSYSRRIQIS